MAVMPKDPMDVVVTVPEMDERPGMGREEDLFTNTELDIEVNPVLVDKQRRNKEFDELAQQQMGNQAPIQDESQPDEVTTRLQTLQAQAEQAQMENAKWRLKASRTEEKLKKAQRRLTELQQQPQGFPQALQQQPYVDSRQLIGKNPDDVLTAQEFTNVWMSMAHALGNQMRGFKDEMLEELRNEQETSSIDPDVEAKLTVAFPWLENLDDASRQRAMQDLSRTEKPAEAQAPATAPAPQPFTGPQVERARAQVRQASYIEPSNQVSRVESSGMSPGKQARSQKIAELKKALDTPGGSSAALKIFAELGAGIVD